MHPQLTTTTSARSAWLLDLLGSGNISTPALVTDADELQQLLSLFRLHLPFAKLFYAVKANQAPELLSFFFQQGLSFDVASRRELLDLKTLGVPGSRMILSNPVKSPATIEAFFENTLRHTVIDNPDDLAALQRARVRLAPDSHPGIFARIRLQPSGVQIDLNSKFGCSEDEAVDLLIAAERGGFRALGVQFHVGTQSWNLQNYGAAVAAALLVIDRVKDRSGITCSSVNIGGGFPDREMAERAGGLDHFFGELAAILQPLTTRGLNIIAEPGRILVSSACSAVCSIIGRSVRGGRPWLYLDDGAYGLFSGRFFDHKQYAFDVLQAKAARASDPLVEYTVAGPTCDSLDIITESILLPTGLSAGDILCTHNMGAYSLSTGNRFNGFGKIATFLGSPAESAQRSHAAAKASDLAA